jgi:membrane protease YdiL (CAAX protease family)
MDTDTAPPPPRSTHPAFFGRFGLRAGWGLAIFLALYVLLLMLSSLFGIAATGHLKELIRLQTEAQAHHAQSDPSSSVPLVPILFIVEDGLTFLGMVVICWFFSRAERRRLSVYGIGQSRFYDVFPGAFWGLAALSLLILILRSAHVLIFDARILHASAIFVYGLKWLLAFILVGFAEEYFFRGYLQFTLTRGLFGLAEKISPTHSRLVAFWIAALATSLVFGSLHITNPGETAFGIFQVVEIGAVFSYALWRTGSLWWAIGFHTTWDWAQSFLYGVPDSGGLSVGRLFQTHAAGRPLLSGGVDGPEGSLFCVPIAVLVLLIIRFTTRPGTQPSLEQDPSPQPAPFPSLESL